VSKLCSTFTWQTYIYTNSVSGLATHSSWAHVLLAVMFVWLYLHKCWCVVSRVVYNDTTGCIVCVATHTHMLASRWHSNCLLGIWASELCGNCLLYSRVLLCMHTPRFSRARYLLCKLLRSATRCMSQYSYYTQAHLHEALMHCYVQYIAEHDCCSIMLWLHQRTHHISMHP
jgi:hypothetical protein